MKTTLLKSSRRFVLIGSFLVLAVSAMAQRPEREGSPLDPSTLASMARDRAKAEPGFKLEVQAREALLKRRFADVERLARRALEYYEGTMYELQGVLVHETLAEAYLLQEKYDRVLEEADICGENAEGGRFGMTQCLALIALGRGNQARQFVLRVYGSFEDSYPGRAPWRLPMDDNTSITALKASVYILRADLGGIMEDSERLADLKAAEKLAPRNANVVVLLATLLAREKRYEEALAYYQTAATINNDEVKRYAEDGVQGMKRAIAFNAKAIQPPQP